MNMREKIEISRIVRKKLIKNGSRKKLKQKFKNENYVFNGFLVNFLRSKKRKFHLKNKNYKGVYTSFDMNAWEVYDYIHNTENGDDEFNQFIKNKIK